MHGFENEYKCLSCKYCFLKSPLFSLLTSEELEKLDNSRIETDFKAGEIIYKQGTPLTHLVIIHEGLGKIYIENSEKDLILNYTRLMELNGGIGFFIDKRHHSSLTAVTDCKTCFLNVDDFRSVLYSNKEFMSMFLKLFSMRIQHTYNQFSLLTQKNMAGRMATAILYLTDEVFNNGSIKNISKQDLADFTAMTKESAFRVLKDFKEEGLIDLDKNTIEIKNKKSLQQIAMYG
ncbi:MAG: Crp/Fnr family transcriptional regulator [Bacteroidota bacterium]